MILIFFAQVLRKITLTNMAQKGDFHLLMSLPPLLEPAF